MSDQVAKALRRSDRELEAARVLAGSGFTEQAVARAYFACFYAAEAALLYLGETRSKHSGVIAEFSRLVIKEGGMDQQMGAILRSLFEARNEADYRFIEAPPESAEQAISQASRFVDEVRAWLRAR
ncbi:MAG TPA: HEPN domain-containing protein [Thermoleophilaceae bacterium]|nr:HEPN domain-containing protein [Thermoleophilaceae bacterium]